MPIRGVPCGLSTQSNSLELSPSTGYLPTRIALTRALSSNMHPDPHTYGTDRSSRSRLVRQAQLLARIRPASRTYLSSICMCMMMCTYVLVVLLPTRQHRRHHTAACRYRFQTATFTTVQKTLTRAQKNKINLDV
jgi:hypothetical protein